MAKNQQLRYSVSRPVVGGVRQAVLTMGDDPSKPLVLLVHGGPGEPMTPFTDSLSGLEERFVVCLWEQRGAGMSYVRKSGNMHISQFVSDALEVTRLLLNRFQREKLILMGFSWGSLVGLLAAAQAPELYSAYIGVGQLSDQAASEKISFDTALEKARKAGDGKSADFLLRNGPPPYTGKRGMKTLIKERVILRKYSDNPAGSPKLSAYLRKIFTCPYYSLSDKINYVRGMNSGASLFSEVLALNVLEAVLSVSMPIYVMQGRHDMQTRPEQAERLIEQIRAPEKKLFLFEKAGHSPLDDDADAFFKVLDTIDVLFDPQICSEPHGNP